MKMRMGLICVITHQSGYSLAQCNHFRISYSSYTPHSTKIMTSLRIEVPEVNSLTVKTLGVGRRRRANVNFWRGQ